MVIEGIFLSLKSRATISVLPLVKAKLWDVNLFGRPQSNGTRSQDDDPHEVNDVSSNRFRMAINVPKME